MGGFENVYTWLDPILIVMFRLSPAPWVGYALGLVSLGLVATIIGELCLGFVYVLNRQHYGNISREMTTNHNLAVRALAYKDKTSYVACNGLANDAFGKNFFSHIALFASSLWPVPFAIGWLDYRFHQIDMSMPVIGVVGPAFVFIPTYILIRIGFARIRHCLPLFRKIKKMIDETETPEKLLNYADIPDLVKTRGHMRDKHRLYKLF
jgi:hypothetical protein